MFRPSNPSSRNPLQRSNDKNAKKHMYKVIYCSTLCNGKDEKPNVHQYEAGSINNDRLRAFCSRRKYFVVEQKIQILLWNDVRIYLLLSEKK